MGVFKNIKESFKTQLLGELVTDLGTHDTGGLKKLSLSIRRRPGKRPYLQLQWHGGGESDYRIIVCSHEWAEQVEKIAQEMRRHAATNPD